jgi:hypothetical protein
MVERVADLLRAIAERESSLCISRIALTPCIMAAWCLKAPHLNFVPTPLYVKPGWKFENGLI